MAESGKSNENHETESSTGVNRKEYVRRHGDKGKELIQGIEIRGFNRIFGHSELFHGELPEGLKSIDIAAIIVEDVKDRFVYDPDKVEVMKQKWGKGNLPEGKTAREVVESIHAEDWQLLDGNIARTFYYRIKPTPEEN